MLTLNFDPFPQLETERLRLRKITAGDVNELFALRSDKDIMQYIARPLMKTKDETLSFIEKMNEGMEKQDLVNWGITLKSDDKLIGTIGFYRMAKEHGRAEVGYMLHTNFHKKGIMQEALMVALDYGFKHMNAHSIGAVIDPRNAASENILIRNGFVKEAHFKEDCFFEGVFLDSVHYSLLAKKSN